MKNAAMPLKNTKYLNRFKKSEDSARPEATYIGILIHLHIQVSYLIELCYWFILF